MLFPCDTESALNAQGKILYQRHMHVDPATFQLDPIARAIRTIGKAIQPPAAIDTVPDGAVFYVVLNLQNVHYVYTLTYKHQHRIKYMEGVPVIVPGFVIRPHLHLNTLTPELLAKITTPVPATESALKKEQL